jgi:DNA-binding NarL/FixJ family response regulator
MHDIQLGRKLIRSVPFLRKMVLVQLLCSLAQFALKGFCPFRQLQVHYGDSIFSASNTVNLKDNLGEKMSFTLNVIRILALVFVRTAAFCPGERLKALTILPINTLRQSKGCFLSDEFKNAEIDTEFEKVKDSQFLNRNTKWVILVDDEESIRMSVGDYLYDYGYRVTACADADAFIQAVTTTTTNSNIPSSSNGQYVSQPIKSKRQQQQILQLPEIPDVIISDIRMPGRKTMDGLELVRYIRNDKRLSKVPIVLLTAKAFTSDRIEGYNAGADAYLTKPFDPLELLAIVDNLISRKKQMAGNNGKLLEIQDEMANIKEILQVRAANLVEETDVYLTLSEREVLEQVSEGRTNSEIAESRGVSPERIGSIVQQLLTKTDTRSRTELVRWGIRTGYISRRF